MNRFEQKILVFTVMFLLVMVIGSIILLLESSFYIKSAISLGFTAIIAGGWIAIVVLPGDTKNKNKKENNLNK